MLLRSLAGFLSYIVIMAVTLALLVPVGVIFLLLTPIIGFPAHRRMQLKSLLRQLPSLPGRFMV
ncbi:MAG: hypothetical protein JXA20_09985 [Spirochaetes bacterium]|nr:hypothetical protein [Spirochaetota bacterium]